MFGHLYRVNEKTHRSKMGAAVCRDWKTHAQKTFVLSRSPTPLPTPHSRSVVLYILSPRPPILATLHFRQVHRDFNSLCISKLVKQIITKVISDINIHNTNSNSKFILQKKSSCHSRNMFFETQTKFSPTYFSTKAEFRWLVHLLHIWVSVRISERNFLYQQKLLLDLSVPSR
jgi:hypothetical protein